MPKGRRCADGVQPWRVRIRLPDGRVHAVRAVRERVRLALFQVVILARVLLFVVEGERQRVVRAREYEYTIPYYTYYTTVNTNVIL